MGKLNVQRCLCGASNPDADPKRFEAHMKEAHGRTAKTWAHKENDKRGGAALVRGRKIVTQRRPSLKLPAGTELGQLITFTDPDGEARAGQVWSQAPRRGDWWVVPTTRHVGEDSALLVHFDREGHGRTWASR